MIKKVIAGKLAVLAFYRHLGKSHGLTCDEKKEAIATSLPSQRQSLLLSKVATFFVST